MDGKDKAVQVIDEARAAVKAAKQLKERVEILSSGWERDLGELKQQVEQMRARGETIDEKKVEAWINDILDRQHQSMVADRIMHAGEARGFTVADPWSQKSLEAYWTFGEAAGDIICKKAFDGLDLLVQLPYEDELHKNFARMAMDVKLLDGIGKLNAVAAGRPYAGFAETFPRTAAKWSWYLDQFVRHYTGKAAGDLMDTTDMANWVPTGWSAELTELVMLKLVVASLFQRFPMPQSPYQFPVDLGDTIAHYMPETTQAIAPYTDTSTTSNLIKFTPSKPTFTARKLRAVLVSSGEFTEDSAVAILPLMRQNAVKAMAKAEEKAVLDGQRGGTLDTGDAPGTYDCRQAWDGLRYVANANSAMTAVGAAMNVTDLIKLRKVGGEYTADVGDQAIIIGIKGSADLLTDSNVLTVDKMGAQATILRGQIAQVGGIPIIVSRYLREDLNANGIYDGTTTDRTIAVQVNTTCWLFGDRREVTLEPIREPISDSYWLVAARRLDFQHMHGSKKSTVVGYNITT